MSPEWDETPPAPISDTLCGPMKDSAIAQSIEPRGDRRGFFWAFLAGVCFWSVLIACYCWTKSYNTIPPKEENVFTGHKERVYAMEPR